MTKRELTRYVTLDCLSAIAVWIAFYVFRRVTIDLAAAPEASAIFVTPSYDLWLSAICYPVMALMVHYLSGYYNTRTRRSRIVELFTTLFSSAIIALVAFFSIMLDDKWSHIRFITVLSWCFFRFNLPLLISFVLSRHNANSFNINQEKYISIP